MGLRFLDFPPELRLAIYRLIYLDNLIRSPLILSGPREQPTMHIITAKAPGGADAGGASGTGATTAGGSGSGRPADRPDPEPLLDHNRKVGRLPTALLLTCKMVYLEARVVPFNESGFWCSCCRWSGLRTAHSFFARLAPWQRDATRFVVLDMQTYLELRGPTPAQQESIRRSLLSIRRRGGRPNLRDIRDRHCSMNVNDPDLVADPVGAFEDFCGYWSAGVRNLRLRITMGSWPIYSPVMYSDDDDDGFFVWPACTRQRSTLPPPDEWMLLQAVVPDETTRPLPWIDVALRRLRALRRLEVELLEEARLSPADKVTWCARLEEMLNRQEERQHRVVVVPIEETRLRKPGKVEPT